MFSTYAVPFITFATILTTSSVFALPYSDLNWGNSLAELKQFSHNNNLHCTAQEKTIMYRCESHYFGQPAKVDFYIDSKLGLFKIDYRMRVGNFRSGLAKSLDQDFRNISRTVARSLIKHYGDASGYISQKQLAYWNNLYNGKTKLKYWVQIEPYHLLRASYSSVYIQSQIEENNLLQAIQNSR